jgi:multiple sugar transport system permease protein
MGGMQATGMTVLFVGLATSILIAGVAGGKSVYRTLFYTPNFVSGVATFILWKKLFNTQNGPINNALQPVLVHIADGVNAVPGGLISSLIWGFFAVFLLLFFMGTGYLRRTVADGDVGKGAALLPFVVLCLPTVVAHYWQLSAPVAWLLLVGCLVCVALQVLFYVRTPNRYSCRTGEGFGSALILCLLLMVGQFVLLGLSQVAWNLPAMASDGLQAPRWLTDVNWAKPSLMGMGLWGALGSNNMLLYLAALTNVPGELYEAADIDGANRLQRFWHITWPQLAATTFFIFVMSTIGGLQGGFEMARVMTAGGPAGATTTLSYYIYMEGFETGRLGFASAVAWALFVLVFSVTLFNWKFGNRYAND